jgi:hypothetical protein
MVDLWGHCLYASIIETGKPEGNPEMTRHNTAISPTSTAQLTPRMTRIWGVLERARDAGDEHVTSACRRLIVADRLGWIKHRDAADWNLVRAFAE